jgi:hypothetical protein
LSRLSSTQLTTIAKTLRRLHLEYTRRPSEGDVSRMLCGYLAGRFSDPRREYPQSYVTADGKVKAGRIDFLLGSPSAGTFIELAILRDGDQWSFKPKFSHDLWKLERAGGTLAKRVQLIIDLRKSKPLSKGAVLDLYRRSWKTTRGRYKRHHVSVMYAGDDCSFIFSLKPKKSKIL